MFPLKQAGVLVILASILAQGDSHPRPGCDDPQPTPTKPPRVEAAPVSRQEDDGWAERADELGMPVEDLRKALVPADLAEARVQALLEASGDRGEMKRLLRERYQAARTNLVARWRESWAGRGTLDILLSASRELLRAESELCRQPMDRRAAYQAHADRMRVLHRRLMSSYFSGRVPVKEPAQVRFELSEAELWLQRERLR
jgi:hypothetical protein